MKKLMMIAVALMVLGSTPAFAMGQVIHVGVNGLVCDFCARSLEKIFGKQESVEKINVDLDEKLVTINLKDGESLDDDTITNLITDAGYNVEKIHRMDGGAAHE